MSALTSKENKRVREVIDEVIENFTDDMCIQTAMHILNNASLKAQARGDRGIKAKWRLEEAANATTDEMIFTIYLQCEGAEIKFIHRVAAVDVAKYGWRRSDSSDILFRNIGTYRG